MTTSIRLALFQPEIAQNVGTLLRLTACLGVPLDIIEPTGFPWDHSKMRRAGMDYIDKADVWKYPSFQEFQESRPGRIILFDVKATCSFYDFPFQPCDTILMGRESDGVPDEIFNACTSVRIPMVSSVRSLNLAVSAAMGLSEALRQLRLNGEFSELK